MIPANQKDDQLLADIASSNVSDQHFRLWWLGQSGFLLQYQRRHLLLDPYLSDSLTRKYADTDKPHVRMTERVVQPETLDFIDVATSSHNHTDHLDAETLVPLMHANPKLTMIVPAANRWFAAERLGVSPDRLMGLDAGERCQVCGFRIDAVPAAHEQLEQDDAGRYRFVGYVVRFGQWTVYHSGDTVRYPGMEQWLGRFRIDVALLPINGRAAERRVAGNLWGREAAQLARDVSARLVIPCHYEMFAFNTANPDEFEQACRAINQPYRTLRCGQRWSSAELRERG